MDIFAIFTTLLVCLCVNARCCCTFWVKNVSRVLTPPFCDFVWSLSFTHSLILSHASTSVCYTPALYSHTSCVCVTLCICIMCKRERETLSWPRGSGCEIGALLIQMPGVLFGSQASWGLVGGQSVSSVGLLWMARKWWGNVLCVPIILACLGQGRGQEMWSDVRHIVLSLCWWCEICYVNIKNVKMILWAGQSWYFPQTSFKQPWRWHLIRIMWVGYFNVFYTLRF